MYTRCKGCHTVHPVNASLLARAGGKFRCGKCNKTGNALEALFDEWPEAGEKPPKTGPIPNLGLAIDSAIPAYTDRPEVHLVPGYRL